MAVMSEKRLKDIGEREKEEEPVDCILGEGRQWRGDWRKRLVGEKGRRKVSEEMERKVGGKR